MKKINVKQQFNNLIEKIKFGFMNNKFTMLLGIGTVIPIIISLNIWDGNAIIGLAVIPVLYRLVCNGILWVLKKKGSPENTKLFNNISRMSVFIGFLILSFLSTILGREEMGIIEMILFAICIAYFDKMLLLIMKSFLIVFSNQVLFTSSSSVESVGSLINETKTTFDRSDGSKIYQDATGRTIGISRHNDATGETTYWNENMQYVGKSGSDGNGNRKYYDSNLNYEGHSERKSNGYAAYYDEKLNYKGQSKKNSNGTSSYFKK